MVKKILFVFLLLSVLRGNIVCGQSVIDSLRIGMSKLGDADTHNEKKAEILKDNIEKALLRDHSLLAMSSFAPLLSTYQLWKKKDSARIYLAKYKKYIEKIPQGSPKASN